MKNLSKKSISSNNLVGKIIIKHALLPNLTCCFTRIIYISSRVNPAT